MSVEFGEQNSILGIQQRNLLIPLPHHQSDIEVFNLLLFAQLL
jgi:hypothetical protein